MGRRPSSRRTALRAIPAAPLLWVCAEVGPRSVEQYADTPRTVLAMIASAGLLPGPALAGAAAAGLDALADGRLRGHRRTIAFVGAALAAAPFVAGAIADPTVSSGDPPQWLVVVGTAGLLCVFAAIGSEDPRQARTASGVLAAALTAVALARDLLAAA